MRQAQPTADAGCKFVWIDPQVHETATVLANIPFPPDRHRVEEWRASIVRGSCLGRTVAGCPKATPFIELHVTMGDC
jgi:hypothetical protein